MDVFNVIFEKYGLRLMEGVFKNLLILPLIFKKFLFSLFLAHAEPVCLYNFDLDIRILHVVTVESRKNVIDYFPIRRLVFDFINVDNETISALQE